MDKVGKKFPIFLGNVEACKVFQEKCFFSHSQQEAEMVLNKKLKWSW
jgi:hypothetical protein